MWLGRSVTGEAAIVDNSNNIDIQGEDGEVKELSSYLTPLSVWALSFGCAVGWGSFVMPGTTFLPGSGPMGTVIGIVIGAIIMYIIGMNYCYLMNRYPDAGGAVTYTINTFGYDHGFVAACFTRFQKIMYFRHVSRVYQRMACHTGRCSLLRSFPASYRLSEEQQSDG